MVAGINLDDLVENHEYGSANDIAYTSGSGQTYAIRGVYIASAKREPADITERFGQTSTDDVVRVRRSTFDRTLITRSNTPNSSLYGRIALGNAAYDVVGYSVGHQHILLHLTQTL